MRRILLLIKSLLANSFGCLDTLLKEVRSEVLVDSNEVFEPSHVLSDFHYYYEPGGNP